MRSKDKKLTSVRLHPVLFNRFKTTCIAEDFTFQKLAERAIYLYLTDEDFKTKVTTVEKIVVNEK
jgi:hypothetical protein